MTKKLMLLVAGALTALAFAALPAGASAEEMTAHCSAAPCTGKVVGGALTLSDTSSFAVACSASAGNTSMGAGVTTSSTFTLTIEFTGCADEAFNTECNNQGAGTKKIVTNALTGHLITVEKGKPATAGVLLTGVNLTFSCPSIFITKTVTGNIIGTFEGLTCNSASTSHKLVFAKTAAGQQAHKTWTGNTFDLTSGSHSSDNTTSAQTGSATITYNEGKTVNITC